MNCREYQHQITLLLYEELTDHDRPELEAHLIECEACKQNYEVQKSLHFVLAEDAAAKWDVPVDVLVEARRGLANELDRIEEKKRAWWHVPTFSVVFTPMRVLESATLVAMGLALGVYISSQQTPPQIASDSMQQNETSLIPGNASVSNLRILSSDPATGDIELAGEVVQPLRFQGTMDDDTVLRLLLSAARDASNSGTRLRAVEALAQKPTEAIHEALIDALVFDENAAVRQQALRALTQFAAEDHVRAAFMHTLANDENAGNRAEAIDALTRYANDLETARTVEELTKTEDNPYVRLKAMQLVGTAR